MDFDKLEDLRAKLIANERFNEDDIQEMREVFELAAEGLRHRIATDKFINKLSSISTGG